VFTRTALPPEDRTLALRQPGERCHRARWQQRHATMAALGVPEDHAAAGKINVAPIQFDGLGHAGAGTQQQFQKRLSARLVRLPHGSAWVTVPTIPKAEPSPEPPPVRPAAGLSRYAETALDQACRRIAAAKDGERNHALNSAAYGIGRLAGAGAIPEGFARRVLHHATAQIAGHYTGVDPASLRSELLSIRASNRDDRWDDLLPPAA
jgi:hypothetical protein